MGHALTSIHTVAKAVFTSTVTLTCVLLLLWTIKTAPFKSEQHRHKPYSISSSNLTAINAGTIVHVWPKPLSPAAVRPQCRPVRVAISVLGRRPERCITGEDDVYISIKTTRRNHKTRLPILLLTWLQSVRPEQVLKFSDDVH